MFTDATCRCLCSANTLPSFLRRVHPSPPPQVVIVVVVGLTGGFRLGVRSLFIIQALAL